MAIAKAGSGPSRPEAFDFGSPFCRSLAIFRALLPRAALTRTWVAFPRKAGQVDCSGVSRILLAKGDTE